MEEIKQKNKEAIRGEEERKNIMKESKRCSWKERREGASKYEESSE